MELFLYLIRNTALLHRSYTCILGPQKRISGQGFCQLQSYYSYLDILEAICPNLKVRLHIILQKIALSFRYSPMHTCIWWIHICIDTSILRNLNVVCQECSWSFDSMWMTFFYLEKEKGGRSIMSELRIINFWI